MYQDGKGFPSLCCVRWYDRFFVTDNRADDIDYVSRLVDSLIDLENTKFMAPVISICDEVHDGIHPVAPCRPFMALLFENEEDYKLARFALPVTHAWVVRYY